MNINDLEGAYQSFPNLRAFNVSMVEEGREPVLKLERTLTALQQAHLDTRS